MATKLEQLQHVFILSEISTWQLHEYEGETNDTKLGNNGIWETVLGKICNL
jgi:hypothetical protein